MKPVAFLFDRNFPRPIARMMEQYVDGQVVARFQDDDERFKITTPDVDIIRTLSEDENYRWVLVSLDKKITKRPAEKATLAAATIKFFYCGKAWHKMKMHEQAWKFLKSWPQIVEVAENHRGKVFEIEGANLKVTPVG
jgi:PIN like domain